MADHDPWDQMSGWHVRDVEDASQRTGGIAIEGGKIPTPPVGGAEGRERGAGGVHGRAGSECN